MPTRDPARPSFAYLTRTHWVQFTTEREKGYPRYRQFIRGFLIKVSGINVDEITPLEE
jgi:hypothetical protein